MIEIPYSTATYRNWISMSDGRFLLVEGDDDKRLFKVMVQELVSDKQRRVHVHSTKDFKDSLLDGLGCRERVEIISQTIERFPCASRFIGFVDREFREFEIGDKLKDNLNKHQVSGRIVWSRGHSVENYYFDFSILRQPLRVFSVTQYFDEALDLFERCFESTIRLACAGSLAGRECENRLSLVKSSIGWETMRIQQNQIVVDLDRWRELLINKYKLQASDAARLVKCFQKWTQVVENADFEVVRWLCHGHVGLTFVWATYGCCVSYSCQKLGCYDRKREVQKVLKAEESVRFNACAEAWLRRILNLEEISYPAEVFNLLGLPIDSSSLPNIG